LNISDELFYELYQIETLFYIYEKEKLLLTENKSILTKNVNLNVDNLINLSF
jgi:hypothetical protein